MNKKVDTSEGNIAEDFNPCKCPNHRRQCSWTTRRRIEGIPICTFCVERCPRFTSSGLRPD